VILEVLKPGMNPNHRHVRATCHQISEFRDLVLQRNKGVSLFGSRTPEGWIKSQSSIHEDKWTIDHLPLHEFLVHTLEDLKCSVVEGSEAWSAECRSIIDLR
jgi:hypothetical protein